LSFKQAYQLACPHHLRHRRKVELLTSSLLLLLLLRRWDELLMLVLHLRSLHGRENRLQLCRSSLPSRSHSTSKRESGA
jgi:hypothetical protein